MSYVESDMDFSPLFENSSMHSFYLEKSDFYKQTADLKTVEFVTIDTDAVHFIEAKRSVPREMADFCEDIYEKFYHSLNLMVTNELGTGKYKAEDLSEHFNELFKNRQVIFILIVKGMPIEHCTFVKNALEERFFQNKILSLVWNVKVIVYNHEISRKKNLIN